MYKNSKLHSKTNFALTSLTVPARVRYIVRIASLYRLDIPLYVPVFQEFKGEAYQLQIEMERLNHQAGLLLKKVTEDADRCAIQEPMSELKMLWDTLDEKIISRQVRKRKD